MIFPFLGQIFYIFRQPDRLLDRRLHEAAAGARDHAVPPTRLTALSLRSGEAAASAPTPRRGRGNPAPGVAAALFWKTPPKVPELN